MWNLNLEKICVISVLSSFFCSHSLAEESRLLQRQPSPEKLASVHEITVTSYTRAKSPLHNITDELIEDIYKSRWRNSIGEVIRLLIESTDSSDRKTGWQLARELGVKMDWSKSDIDKIINEPIDQVKIAGIRAVAVTDTKHLSECIQRVIELPEVNNTCKKVAILQLGKVPAMSDRVKIWLAATGDVDLRGACISVFPSLDSSEATIRVMIEYLNDTSVVNVGVSEHFGRSTELRTLACQSLSSVHANEDVVIEAIMKQCDMQPAMNSLEFFHSAMVAVHELDPDSSQPINRIIKWYKELPLARSIILQDLKDEFLDSSEFESLVISGIHKMSIDQKYHVCEWLSCRTSIAASEATKGLLNDPHPGICVAAAVALTKQNPLFDLSTKRDELLKVAALQPEEFSGAFQSLNDAVCSLALAGLSDDEAIAWLQRQGKNVDLEPICNEALESLLIDLKLGSKRYIFWKSAR